eukprot:gene37879-46745_t
MRQRCGGACAIPLESGLDLARGLCRQELPPLVVFVTAHRGHALEAFDVHALDYIVKPVDPQRLRSALERAGAVLEQRAAYGRALREFADPSPGYWRELAVRSVGRIDRVRLDEVLWMDSAGNYVSLHLELRTLLHRCTLTELETHLDPAEFLRIHRRMLVRRRQMLALRQPQEGGYFLQLHCGEELAVSERYVAAVKAALCAEAGRPNTRSKVQLKMKRHVQPPGKQRHQHQHQAALEAHRVRHPVGFEGGLVLVLVPLFAWWLNM